MNSEDIPCVTHSSEGQGPGCCDFPEDAGSLCPLLHGSLLDFFLRPIFQVLRMAATADLPMMYPHVTVSKAGRVKKERGLFLPLPPL